MFIECLHFLIPWYYLPHLCYIYTIHLSWCFGMGRQWCFLWDHGGFRVFQHQTPSPKWPSWHRSNSNSHPGSQPAHPHKEKTKKMTIEKALYIILQQPIRAKLYWWLLNLFFKNREATLLCFFFCYNFWRLSFLWYMFIECLHFLIPWYYLPHLCYIYIYISTQRKHNNEKPLRKRQSGNKHVYNTYVRTT